MDGLFVTIRRFYRGDGVHVHFRKCILCVHHVLIGIHLHMFYNFIFDYQLSS